MICPECEGLTVICSCRGAGCGRCGNTGTGRCPECDGTGREDRRYDVLTWDSAAQQYTEQDGMKNPCLGVDLHGVRRALRELRSDFGYSCHRYRLRLGDYASDAYVLVERVDDPISDDARIWEQCEDCGGRGWTGNGRCLSCGGAGGGLAPPLRTIRAAN